MIRGLTWFSVLLMGMGVPVQAWTSELIPHHALYRMHLSNANANSGIAGAEGAMMYRFEESCDAWTSETNVFLKLIYAEGEAMETTWSFVSWEAKSGLKYRFRVRQSRDGDLIENLKGDVTRNTRDGAAVAKFDSPQDTSIELPDGTMFPTRHLLALLEESRAGTVTFARTVFDGASLDNPYRINALISRKLKSAKKRKDTPGSKAFRHVRMAFFPLDSRDEFPEFELGVNYRENGIAELIEQDFGDFTLELSPDKIEMLNRPDC